MRHNFTTGSLFKAAEPNYRLKEGCVWFDDREMRYSFEKF